MLKNGKCSACGAVPQNSFRVLDVYKTAHDDPKRTANEAHDCEQSL